MPVTASTPDPSLTRRELELLTRVANGESYPQIAADWVVAHVTVRTTGARVMRKLGANTITHAVFVACRLGVLDPRRRHGDHAGFVAHVRRGEEPCPSCREGEREYKTGRRAARQASSGPPNSGILDTVTGGQVQVLAGRLP
jgi:DNA-binding CsgD family transcriptional regulator